MFQANAGSYYARSLSLTLEPYERLNRNAGPDLPTVPLVFLVDDPTFFAISRVFLRACVPALFGRLIVRKVDTVNCFSQLPFTLFRSILSELFRSALDCTLT